MNVQIKIIHFGLSKSFYNEDLDDEHSSPEARYRFIKKFTTVKKGLPCMFVERDHAPESFLSLLNYSAYFCRMGEKPLLEVCLSPALLHLYDTRNTVVVIIDIFRATSTIPAALHNGARAVIPLASVAECLAMTNQRADCITAGERDGKVIPGLQYGNSPLEYDRELITGKTLAITTTNGTRLLHMIKDAAVIITGSFLNLDAVCDFLMRENRKVLLACAAWKDRVNMEDSLFAGAVVSRLKNRFRLQCDSAIMAHALFRQAERSVSLLAFLENSSHYRRLSDFGLQKDMKYCTTLNLHPVVPVYRAGELVVLEQPVMVPDPASAIRDE